MAAKDCASVFSGAPSASLDVRSELGGEGSGYVETPTSVEVPCIWEQSVSAAIVPSAVSLGQCSRV